MHNQTQNRHQAERSKETSMQEGCSQDVTHHQIRVRQMT